MAVESIYEKMLPDMRLEPATARMPGGCSSDQASTASVLQNPVKNHTLQIILAQSTYLENNVTTYKTLLSNRNIHIYIFFFFICKSEISWVLLLLGNYRTYDKLSQYHII